MNQLTEDQFEEKYKPQINHIVRAVTSKDVADEDICSFNGRMYETYGEEQDYVLEMAKQNRVVTIIEGEEEEGDDGEMHPTMYYSSGYHHVNRIGHFVTEVPLTEEFDIKLDW